MSIFSNFFKPKAIKNSDDSVIDEEFTNEIKLEISQIKKELSNLEDREKAKKYTVLGEKYQKINFVDDAIFSYEKSIELEEDFGPAFDGLIQLYDLKRKKAAFKKDDAEIQKWINKTDELTTLSKKIMRSK